MIELHRHWDVCVRHSTWLEIAQNLGLEAQSTSLEAFKKKVILDQPLASLNEVLARFEYLRKIFVSPDLLTRFARESAEDCIQEQMTAVEFRYSPNFLCDLAGLDWQESLVAIQEGFRETQSRHPELQIRLIAIASRESSEETMARTVEFAIQNQNAFCGIDLAGPENLRAPKTYRSLLAPARTAGLNITIHAGEGTPAHHIWEAIDDLGAKRIGHGTSLFEDPELPAVLRKRSICLEMCPTSNRITRAVPELTQHPLARALRAGIPVCINTDDPAIFGVTLPGEVAIAKNIIGLSDTELALCQKHAAEHQFT